MKSERLCKKCEPFGVCVFVSSVSAAEKLGVQNLRTLSENVDNFKNCPRKDEILARIKERVGTPRRVIIDRRKKKSDA